MLMTLEITGAAATRLGSDSRRRIDERGVTIGRCAQRSAWVIDHAQLSYVSRLHARVSFQQGAFYVTGLGANPIAVHEPSNRVPNGQPHQLGNGDRFFVEDYEIKTMVEAEEGAHGADPFDGCELRARHRPTRDEPPDDHFAEPAHAIADHEVHNILELIKGADGDADADVPAPRTMRRVDAVAMDPSTAERASMSDAPHHRDQAEPQPYAPDQLASLEDLLRSAKVPAELPDAVQRNAGRLVWIVMQGVVDLLRSRFEIKYEGGASSTRYQAVHNNPLKLSPNALTALHALLVQSDQGFLGIEPALAEAMDDLRRHQLVVMKTARCVFEEMLDSFEPDHLKALFARRSSSRLLSIGKKAQFHDLYAEHFGQIAQAREQLFQRYFSTAYEKYENELKASPQAHAVQKSPVVQT